MLFTLKLQMNRMVERLNFVGATANEMRIAARLALPAAAAHFLVHSHPTPRPNNPRICANTHLDVLYANIKCSFCADVL